MKIIIEHHLAGIPKGEGLIGVFFFWPLEVYIYEIISKLYWRVGLY